MNFGTSVTVRLIRCPLNAGYVGSFVSNMKEKRFSEKKWSILLARNSLLHSRFYCRHATLLPTNGC